MENLERYELLLRLQQLPGVGSASILALLDEVSLDRIEGFTFADLQKTGVSRIRKGLDAGIITQSLWDAAGEHAKLVLEQCEELSIHLVDCFDSLYPANMKALRRFPVLLYVRGDASILNASKSVAVIGSRDLTPFAAKMDDAISSQLSSDGYVIVSGLAIGADAHAHTAAVRSGKPTIAILGQGLGTKPYPAENRRLAEEIVASGGALVSEYEPMENVTGRNLVQRDAWQAGLSDGVLSIEAATGSGSLHAMSAALQYKRPLGILDHKEAADALHRPDLALVPQAEGLEQYARRAPDQVYRIFSEESVRRFEQAMAEARRRRIGAQ